MRRTPKTYPSLLERSNQEVRSLSPVQNACLSAPARLVFLSQQLVRLSGPSEQSREFRAWS